MAPAPRLLLDDCAATFPVAGPAEALLLPGGKGERGLQPPQGNKVNRSDFAAKTAARGRSSKAAHRL